MHPAIETRLEPKRGCGYRKPGGLYLVSDGPAAPCGKLPIPLEVCPCCGAGIKPSRGWTWVNGTLLAREQECRAAACRASCPLALDPGRVGLLWIGEVFYPTPGDWSREAKRLGVSRRIPAVPRDFKAGETWVWVAHRKAIERPCPRDCPPVGANPKCPDCRGVGTVWAPGVFHAFRPQRVEYVVTGRESDEEIDALLSRGLTPVKVVRDDGRDQALVFDQESTS